MKLSFVQLLLQCKKHAKTNRLKRLSKLTNHQYIDFLPLHKKKNT